jgi:hypothetical protein
MRLSRVRCAAVAAIAVVGTGAGLVASSAASAASSASAPRWRIVGRTSGNLNAVVAPSLRTQWAFGAKVTSKPLPPVALRHLGSRWVQAVLPATAKGDIVCAGASSPSDVWAFEGESYGPFGANSAAALQLRSGHWVRRHEFAISAGGVTTDDLFVTGCNVLSPTDVWAFGSTGAGLSIGTWHLHGRTWTHMTSSPASFLGQASVISSSNIWATGWNGIEGVLAHWNGSSWKTDNSLIRALPKPSSTVEVQVAAVTAINSHELWVEAQIGREGKGGTWHYGPQVERWDGAKWSKAAASAFGYYLPATFAGTRGNWWSAGYPSTASVTPSMTYLLHSSHGRWVKVPLPKAKSGYRLEITSVANVPGSRVAYAVGNEINKKTGYGSGVILKVTY